MSRFIFLLYYYVTMIRARSLFLIPIMSSCLLLIPVVGIPLFLFTVFFWYVKNQEEIHIYCKGGEYRMNELSDDEIINML